AEMINGPAPRQRLERFNREIGNPRTAIPLDLDRDRAQHLPTARIGDRQWQAAVRVAVGERVHPPAMRPRRHQGRRKLVERVAFELHSRSLICPDRQGDAPLYATITPGDPLAVPFRAFEGDLAS